MLWSLILGKNTSILGKKTFFGNDLCYYFYEKYL